MDVTKDTVGHGAIVGNLESGVIQQKDEKTIKVGLGVHQRLIAMKTGNVLMSVIQEDTPSKHFGENY